MYDLNKIKEYLNTKSVGQTAIQFNELMSTNAKAKNIFDTCPDGTVIISENQTKCKVRFGREWICVPDKAIYLSIIIKPFRDDYNISKFETITLASVCKAVNNMYNLDCKIKWPNDIYINDKKVCSINCEISSKKNKKVGIIIYFGINTNIELDEFDVDLKSISTSISNETNIVVDREMIIAAILNCFEGFYDELLNYNNIHSAINVYKENFLLDDRNIFIKKPRNKTGKFVHVQNIDCDGNLVVINEVGKQETLNSGEVAIKYEKEN